MHPSELISLLVPKPNPYPLIRIGGRADGAYLIPDDLEGITQCFSPGSNGIKSFEDDLANRFGIKSQICDGSCHESDFQTPLIAGMQVFHQKWLALVDTPSSLRLSSWIQEQAKEQEDLMLQMDIEGAEYEILNEIPQDVLLRFRIIVVELHNLSMIASDVKRKRVLEPLVRKLTGSHTPVHAHPNNCCGEVTAEGVAPGMPRVLELTLLRNDRFLGESEEWLEPHLPHDLDIDCNSPNNPPIFLGSQWRNRDPNVDELKKQLSITNSYLSRMCERLPDLKDDSRALDLVVKFWGSQDRGTALTQPGQSNRKDLAVGKAFSVSSRHGADPGFNLIKENRPFFFHTKPEVTGRITIDLGSLCMIQALELANRTDGFQQRLRHLLYACHADLNEWAPNLRPLVFDGSPILRNGEPVLFRIPVQTARYVSLVTPHNVPLHLSAFRALGSPVD